jgi:predicted AlkP superfamily phosphohydrolase/phosphomutase/tetratricopeptide (TPR) repeat protein
MAGPLQWGIAGVVLGVAALSCRNEPSTSATPTKPSTAAVGAAAPASEVEDVATRTKRPAGSRAPVIWLGLDGLDFELVDRLAAEGRMPNWKRLASQGYTARLKSYQPILSPIVWTTEATGVGPDVHRVLDFQEVDPATGQKVAISGQSRAVPAIWNVASSAGLSVGVVGWWATHPAEEVKGFFVSDRASPILFDGLAKDGVAYPATFGAGVVEIATRENRVTDEELTKFVAMSAAEIAKERASAVGLSDPVVALARTIGATRADSRIARDLYDRTLPDLTMVYFEGTDVIGHLFATDYPPKMDCVSEEEFARYGHTVQEYFALVDHVLGQWMRRAEEDGATLIVTSDHGFKWGTDRSCEKGSLNPATAAFYHRLEGVFAAMGPRVRGGGERGHASVYDVEPTVAALLGLPIDDRAQGSPIKAAFRDLPTPPRKNLTAEIPVRRLATQKMSAAEADEYAKKLMALGYLSGGDPGKLAPSGGDRPGMTEGAWNNLGLYFLALGGTKNQGQAEAAFEKAISLRADYASPKLNLAVVRRNEGKDSQAIDFMFQAIAAGHPDADGTILDWALIYGVKGKAKESREVLERGARTFPNSEGIARALAVSYYQSKSCPQADVTLARFEATTANPETLNALALVRTCLGRRDEAVRLFRRSLSINPNQDAVVRSLAVLEGAAPSGEKPRS